MPKQKKLCLDWQPHKAELQNLYLVQDLPLERLMRYMEETHGFRATKAQYETQLRKWNIRKNLTNEEWNYTLLQVRKRKFDGKESDVYLNGRMVAEKRVKKEMSRHFTLTQEQSFGTVSIPSTPEAITVSTPNATVPAAAGNMILYNNLPYFQLQAYLEPVALFQISPAQTPLIGAPRQIALDSQIVDLPSFASRDSLALFQGIMSPSHPTSNEEGQMLLARLFGPRMKADGHASLSQIRSQMLVSSLERYDGELLEKFQLLCGPSRQSSVLQILELALYRLSNNLLAEKATDEFTRWLIRQQQDGLLALFLKTQLPTVHACATKILESVLRVGDVDFLELLIDTGIDISPLKGVCGGRNLVHAASQGNPQIVQILLKNGADVNILPSGRYPSTALQSATSKGHAHIVQVLLKAGANVDAVSAFDDGYTALSRAVDQENVELVRILLTAGANVDAVSAFDYRNTALSEAVNQENVELVRILLTAGANVDAVSAFGDRNTALSKAVDQENVELVRILLTAGANIDICTIGNRPAIVYSALYPLYRDVYSTFEQHEELHQILVSASSEDYSSITIYGVSKAAGTGTQALSEYLAEKGKTGDLEQEVLESALIYLCDESDHTAVISLLDIGVDPNCLLSSNIENDLHEKIREGGPLRNAVSGGDVKLIKILLQAGADVNTPGILSSAISWSHDIEMLQFMLNEGADINTHGKKALRRAVYIGNFEAVHFLLLSGVGVKAGDKFKILTVLQEAVLGKSIRLVKVLLNAGADVNGISYRVGHQTALEIAVGGVVSINPQELEMVQVLLAAGADVNIPKEFRIGISILQSAIAKGNEELISILLKGGADVNSPPRGKEGRSPVQEAARTGNLSLIKLLLELGAKINAPAGDYYGRTAIQAASSAELPTMELIDFLLDAGADMNAPAGHNGGVTSLQGAAIRGHMRIALKFLEAGADVNAAAAIVDGRTALDGAAEHGRLDMVQMLLNAGACGDSTKSHRFEKAIELARENGHFAIASLLERA